MRISRENRSRVYKAQLPIRAFLIEDFPSGSVALQQLKRRSIYVLLSAADGIIRCI